MTHDSDIRDGLEYSSELAALVDAEARSTSRWLPWVQWAAIAAILGAAAAVVLL
jgi:hypothetical protein